MRKKIETLLGNEKYKRMISNFSYLSVLNIANKVLPLIVVPYIVRTVGVEKFGIIAFAQAIMVYLHVFTRWSFDLTATKFIAQYRQETQKISEYFWDVIFSQVILFLLVVVLFLPILFGVEKLYMEKEVFFYSFIFVFANIFIPIWFFQGMEEMKYIAIFNLATKLIYAVLVFLFITEEMDYIYIPLLNSVSYLATGAASIYLIIHRYRLSYFKISLKKIKELLVEGKDIFISNASVLFYTQINSVLLGFFTNYTTVGYYSLAEAIYGAYVTIVKLYVTVVYPHLASFGNDIKQLVNNARKFFRLYIVLLVFSSIFLFVGAEFFITLLFGEGHERSVIVLRLLALSILIEPLGPFFTAYLSVQSKYTTIRNITFMTLIFNFVIIVPAILAWQEIGIAIAFLLSACMMLFLNYRQTKELFVWKEKR